MDIKKIILYILVGILGFFVFQQWMHDYPPQGKTESTASNSVTPAAQQQTNAYSPGAFNPKQTSQTVSTNTQNSVGVAAQTTTPTQNVISVKTDVFHIQIDEQSGDIVSAKLPQYPVSIQDKNTPIQILDSSPQHLYTLQTGLSEANTPGGMPILFTAPQKEYQLQPGQNTLSVELFGKTATGLTITKTYTFTRNQYAIQLSYQITNTKNTPWEGSLFSQIVRNQPEKTGGHFGMGSAYDGGSISSPKIPYKKVDYKALDESDINENIQGGWVAMQQHYFLVAAIPTPKQTNHFYSHVIRNAPNHYILGFVSPQISVAAGQTAEARATFYIGPEIAKSLKVIAPGLERTVDYGWLWPISVLLFWVMSMIQKIVRNWGFTIIFTTILIKIVFYWFSAASFRSMARMREVQPRIQALKERYGDDRQGLSKATMDLYRKEGVNPLGGCLPMFIQMPVFIAFYYVMIESVQLRQAPFIFWIHDLSVMDPYYVLPILMGLSMLLQQFISPVAVDPTQKKMMWILPVIFTVFFINFPSGLVLYWITNNLVQTLQQWYVNKTYEKHKNKLRIKRERKNK